LKLRILHLQKLSAPHSGRLKSTQWIGVDLCEICRKILKDKSQSGEAVEKEVNISTVFFILFNIRKNARYKKMSGNDSPKMHKSKIGWTVETVKIHLFGVNSDEILPNYIKR
jgi:hypothetical protein